MITFSRLGKIFIPAFLTICSSIMITGCGKSSNSGTEATTAAGTEEALSEYTYVADYLPLDLGDSYSYQFINGKVYSVVSDDSGVSNLMAVDAASGAEIFRTDVASVLSAPTEMKEDSYFYGGISSYQVMQDGSVHAVLGSAYYEGVDYDLVSQSYYLVQLSEQGEILSQTDLSEIIDLKDDYIQYITADAQENTVLVCGKQIVRIGSDGSNAFIPLSEDSWVSSILDYKDETFLMMYDQEWNMNAYRMDFDGGKLEEAFTGFDSNANKYYAGKDETVLEVGYTGLRRRNLEDNSSELILNWTDCDLVGDYVQSLSENEDGTFSVLLHDWNSESTEIATLRRVKREELGDFTEITIATLYQDQALMQNVIGFNKSQKQYHITIQTFYDDENGMSYDDAYTAFNNALTGSNPPDLVVMDMLDLETMSGKNLLEDLQPYLEQSSALSIDDYEDFVLDVNRKNGKLLAIPTSLYVNTIAVSSDLVGEGKNGWTVDEMLDLLAAHPEASALEYSNRSYMMSYFLGFAMDGFVDWDKGTCNFDSDTFRRILEYLATQPEEYVWDESDSRSSAGKIADGDVLLLQSYMSDPSEIQVNDAVLGGKAVYIGYPTLDGTPTAEMNANGGYAMLASSAHKDAAWAFIEYSSSANEANLRYSYGLPARTSERDKVLADYVNGKTNIEGNGVGWGDDFSYTYHNVTNEELELFKQILATGKVRSNRNNEIISIIDEEAAAFYAGQKTVEEVTQIIQSRVSLYVNENK